MKLSRYSGDLPRKAIILAAGFGTRMLPLSAVVPKPMLPLWNVPMLEHHLAMLQRWGVREALVNLHHAPVRIVEFLRQPGPLRGIRITCSFEPEIRGTGGALARATWFFDDTPIWILNADIAADLDPTPLLTAWRRKKPLAVLWMDARCGPRTVSVDDAGRITDFRAAGRGTPGTFTFCGLQLLDRRVLKFLPPNGVASIVGVYEKAMRAGHTIAGVVAPRSFWADLGTPAAYLDAHAAVKSAAIHGGAGKRLCLIRDGQRGGFCAAAKTATIASGARIGDSVIMGGAVIGRHARLARCIVGPDARFDGRADNAIIMAAVDYPDRTIRETIRTLGWNIQSTSMIPFPPRGSARSFHRLACGARAAIMIRYSLERPENAHYVPGAHFLARAGIRVPAILFHQPRRFITVVEDLGDESLLEIVNRRGIGAVMRHYRATLALTARLHGAATAQALRTGLRLTKPFNRRLFHWEHAFFAEHLLAYRCKLVPADYREALDDLAQNAMALEKLPRVLVHRDLQSTNIIFRAGQPALIDFQGMRYGPALYDVASLLCDPYVSLPEAMQLDLLNYYLQLTGGVNAVSDTLFWRAAVQRLVQALGAYGRLGGNPATSEFLRHIRPGLAMLRRALSHLDDLPAMTRLAERIAAYNI